MFSTEILWNNSVKHLALFSLLLHVEVATATAVEQLITKLLLYNC